MVTMKKNFILVSVPAQCPRSPITSTHRCLLVSEIFWLILAFIQQCNELSEEGEYRMLGRRTLASLSRTCRTFSAPALDLLWMRLDSLDPLIKVLPSRIWAKERPHFVVRMFMRNKHWFRFRQYAERVRFLRGPCRDISPSIQRDVVSALAHLSGASLPLLPNLTELVWNEPDISYTIDPTVSLIKFFAGPRVTTVSLFLLSWPIHVSARAVLADLPDLFPNVTSFTAIPRATLVDHSQDIGEIVSKWTSLRALYSCALSQSIIDGLASRETLHTLKIKLNRFVTEVYVDKLPPMVHTFSIEGGSILQCIRYLQMLQGAPTHFYLHVGLDFALPTEVDVLFRVLPQRFDATRLQSLTVSLRTSCHRTPALCSFPLTEHILAPLSSFSALVTLDLDSFCTSELDDAAYERIMAAWPQLTSLKLGVEDAFRANPVASVGALIAVLRSCPYLETLHMVFDGSIPPPPPMMVLDVGAGTGDNRSGGAQGGILEGGRMGDDEERERLSARRVPSWGVSNERITQIHVGHSPIVEDTEGLDELVSCLRSLMPRLRRIKSRNEPFGMLDMLDFSESERWQTVQRMLVEPDGTT